MLTSADHQRLEAAQDAATRGARVGQVESDDPADDSRHIRQALTELMERIEARRKWREVRKASTK